MTSRGVKCSPASFAALFRKAPQQFLVDVAHLQAGELVRAKLQFLVLIQDRGESVVLHHQADGGAIVEVLDDIVDVLGEAVDVGAEILLQQYVVLRIDLAQRPVGPVREGRLPGVEFEFLDEPGEFLLGERGPFGQHLGALGLAPGQQHALQPADDDDGQDDALVLVSLELAAQALGRFPDIAGEVVEFGLVECE